MRSRYPQWLLAVWVLPVSASMLQAQDTRVPAFVAHAVDDAARRPEQREQDALRKPLPLLVFAGVKPGGRVLDFMAGNGYFTRLFSRAAGGKGRVYAFLPQEQVDHCDPSEIAGTLALAHDPRYRNVKVLTGPAEQFSVGQPLDLIWIAEDYHDLHDAFMGPVDIKRFNTRLFESLKPGGVLIIIDHVAQQGSGLRDTESLHRIDPSAIVKEVTASGFVLDGESSVLRNAADSHTLRVFDPAIRGHTDQAVFRFRKPTKSRA